MMYGNKLAACVKVAGKVLRESGNKVILPFGAEYSLSFKNMHSERVAISVLIDGKDVMNGSRLVVQAFGTADLERFVENHSEGRKFKFIKRTAAIENHRGVGMSDGVIEIRYQFEAPKPPIAYINSIDSPCWRDSFGGVKLRTFTSYCGSPDLMNSVSVNSASASIGSVSNATTTANTSYSAQVDPGITVEGSKSDQQFNNTYLGVMDSQIHSLVIELAGSDKGEVVKKAVTVRTKKTCPSCGTSHSSKYEFCPNDGTALRVSA